MGSVCPNCGSSQYEMIFPIIAKQFNLGYTIACQCGWKGNGDDLLDENEWKNTKRTKIIDSIIGESQ